MLIWQRTAITRAMVTNGQNLVIVGVVLFFFLILQNRVHYFSAKCFVLFWIDSLWLLFLTVMSCLREKLSIINIRGVSKFIFFVLVGAQYILVLYNEILFNSFHFIRDRIWWVLSTVFKLVKDWTVFARLFSVALAFAVQIVAHCCHNISDRFLHELALRLLQVWSAWVRFERVRRSFYQLLINRSFSLGVRHTIHVKVLCRLFSASIYIHRLQIVLLWRRISMSLFRLDLGLILGRNSPPRFLSIIGLLSYLLMLLILPLFFILRRSLVWFTASLIYDFVNQTVIREGFGFSFRAPILSLASLRLYGDGARIHVLQWRTPLG